jgi:hypothetical protein
MPFPFVSAGQGGAEAAGNATGDPVHPDRFRSGGARCQPPGLWPLGRGRAQADGNADAAENASGYVQQNPWLTIANKQLELMHKYMTEFGLSPVSRSRVAVGGQVTRGQGKFAGLLGQRPWLPADNYLPRR